MFRFSAWGGKCAVCGRLASVCLSKHILEYLNVKLVPFLVPSKSWWTNALLYFLFGKKKCCLVWIWSTGTHEIEAFKETWSIFHKSINMK